MSKSSERRFSVETWNGYDIYVDGDGMFFVFSEDRETRIENKNIDALKRVLSVGREVNVLAYTAPSWGDDSKTLAKVTIVKVTGLGNMMYKRGDGGPIERFRRHDTVYSYDPAREGKRLALVQRRRELTKELEAHMKSWPRVEAAKL